MKKLPTHPRSRRSLDPQSKSTEWRNEEIRELSHAILNRLTAINLCCFSLRKLPSRRQGSAVTWELDRIEAAVEHAGKLVQTLTATLQNRRPPLVIDKHKILARNSSVPATKPSSRDRAS
jgi:hypothetical protein